MIRTAEMRGGVITEMQRIIFVNGLHTILI